MRLSKSLPHILIVLSLLCLLSFVYTVYEQGNVVVQAPLGTPVVQGVTIAWVGDMVPGLDDAYNETVFDAVSTELQKPDLMIGNLEGTFAHADRLSKCTYLLSMCHAFRGDTGFAQSIKRAGFDVVSLVNNHSFDYGKPGLDDTEDVLHALSVPSITPLHPTLSIMVKGKHIGILGLSSTEPTKTITDYDFIQKEVSGLKKENDIVIVIFHGGAEGSTKTFVTGETEYMGTENRGNVQLVAHTAIDAGADIVFGSGPHVLRKIEYYKGKLIAYSLGNFVGGNERLVTKGTLALSGIITATVNKTSITDTFTSVLLSKDGVPYIDQSEQSKALIESLK